MSRPTERRLGVPVVLGAHVGETSLLTRAALPLAREAADLFAQEGAFGARLLVEDPCRPSLVFGRGGILAAPPPASGFGISLEAPGRWEGRAPSGDGRRASRREGARAR